MTTPAPTDHDGDTPATAAGPPPGDDRSVLARAREVADEVLSHPEHAAGMVNPTMTVTAVARPHAEVVRLTGHLGPVADPDEWAAPNITLRLTVPVPDSDAVSRVYTVRRAGTDGAGTWVEVDLVTHPHPSPVMRWLEVVAPGDTVPVVGPRRHLVPATDPATDAAPALLLADATGVPAVHSILAQWPAEAPGRALVSVPAEVAATLPRPAGVTVDLVAPGDEALLAAARAAGSVASVWAAGERHEMRALRTWARQDLGLPADRVRVFGYWSHRASGTELDARRVLHLKALLDAGRPMADFDDFEIPD